MGLVISVIADHECKSITCPPFSPFCPCNPDGPARPYVRIIQTFSFNVVVVVVVVVHVVAWGDNCAKILGVYSNFML